MTANLVRGNTASTVEWRPVTFGEYPDADEQMSTTIIVKDNLDGHVYLGLNDGHDNVCCSLPHNLALCQSHAVEPTPAPVAPAIPEEVRESIERLVFDAMLHRQGVAAGMGYRPDEVTYPPHITIVQAWVAALQAAPQVAPG
jgi:hypothetical protein